MEEKKKTAKIGYQERDRKSCLCLLPIDILQIIFGYLSVLDYLTICAVSKCWQSTFLKCPIITSQNKAKRQQLPWFVLLRTDDVEEELSTIERPSLYTTGEVGSIATSHVYNPTNLPELHETQFLLSRHGWLLLFSSRCCSSSSLFFLNPFSRARINLPFMDVSKLRGPAFDISASPTSTDCAVFVISCCAAKNGFEISTCRRGESVWTTNVYKTHWNFWGVVLNTVFVKGTWYCLHEEGEISAFDSVSFDWKCLGFPKGMTRCYLRRPLSHAMKYGDQVHLLVHSGVWSYEIALKEPLELVKRENYFIWLGDIEFLFRTSMERAIVQFQDEFLVDSFNTNAWCCKLDSSENQMRFHWHNFKSYVNKTIFRLDKNLRGCHCLKKSCTILALFEPEWVHPSLNLDWILGG